jgi:hypothetical protein
MNDSSNLQRKDAHASTGDTNGGTSSHALQHQLVQPANSPPCIHLVAAAHRALASALT